MGKPVNRRLTRLAFTLLMLTGGGLVSQKPSQAAAEEGLYFKLEAQIDQDGSAYCIPFCCDGVGCCWFDVVYCYL